MKLKSFGCSVIWGSEMPDLYTPNGKFVCSQLTWPALLSRALDLQYECLAWPGRGNFIIANQVLDQLATNEPALYIINWSWIDRFDFVDLTNREGWETLRPGRGNHAHGDFYYRNLHSELRDKLHNLQLIKLVTMELLAADQPFIMCYMDDLIFDQRWHTTPAMIKQQEFIKPMMLHWKIDQEKLVNWSFWAAMAGHPITASNHLLESGHHMVFCDVLERLKSKEIVTVSQFDIDKIKTA